VFGLLGRNNSIGGLAGLVQAFQKNGLADIVNSLVTRVRISRFPPSKSRMGLVAIRSAVGVQSRLLTKRGDLAIDGSSARSD
jgi:hypothetical protein